MRNSKKERIAIIMILCMLISNVAPIMSKAQDATVAESLIGTELISNGDFEADVDTNQVPEIIPQNQWYPGDNDGKGVSIVSQVTSITGYVRSGERAFAEIDGKIFQHIPVSESMIGNYIQLSFSALSTEYKDYAEAKAICRNASGNEIANGAIRYVYNQELNNIVNGQWHEIKTEAKKIPEGTAYIEIEMYKAKRVADAVPQPNDDNMYIDDVSLKIVEEPSIEPVGETVNLLQNSDFETQGSWSIWTADTAQIKQDASAHSGTQVMEISSMNTGSGGGQEISTGFLPGEKMKMTCFIKTAAENVNAQWIMLKLAFRNEAGVETLTQDIDISAIAKSDIGNWVSCESKEFVIPADTKTIMVMWWSNPRAEGDIMYLDDVKLLLEKNAEAPSQDGNLLHNGTFENLLDTSWGIWNTPANAEVQTTEKHTGDKSLAIGAVSGAALVVSGSAIVLSGGGGQDVTTGFSVGDTVQLSVWTKKTLDNSAWTTMTVQCKDENGNVIKVDDTEVKQEIQISSNAPTDKWKQLYSNELIIPEGTQKIQVMWWSQDRTDTNDILYLDDVFLNVKKDPSKPVNLNATEETKKIAKYLNDLTVNNQVDYKGTIVGQNVFHGNDAPEGYRTLIQKLEDETGHSVGMISVDYEFMRKYTSKQLTETNAVLKHHWDKGGMVTINWSPVNPAGGDIRPGSGVTKLDMNRLITSGDSLHDSWMESLDRIAAGLLELQEAGVVVLWRPMQEMNGDWFWWSKDTAGAEDNQDYINVYRHMYNYFTNVKGLNNLLWVFSPTGSASWSSYPYPGDDVVDIIGGTTYNDLIMPGLYGDLLSYGKTVGLAEFGASEAAGGPASTATIDDRKYIENIEKYAPGVAYWVSWSDWTGMTMSIVGNQYAEELMDNTKVIKNDWRDNNVKPGDENLLVNGDFRDTTDSMTGWKTSNSQMTNVVDNTLKVSVGSEATTVFQEVDKKKYFERDNIKVKSNIKLLGLNSEAKLVMYFEDELGQKITILDETGNETDTLKLNITATNGEETTSIISTVPEGTQKIVVGIEVIKGSVEATNIMLQTLGTTLINPKPIPKGPALPYIGIPFEITKSTTIEAEQFDKGGQTWGYYDLTDGNNADTIRTNEDVDLERHSIDPEDYNLSSVQPGEWLNYHIDVKEAGSYRIEVYAAYDGKGGFIKATFGPAGENKTGVDFNPYVAVNEVQIESDGWQSYKAIDMGTVELKEGVQQLRLMIVKDSQGLQNYDCGNIDKIVLTQESVANNPDPSDTRTIVGYYKDNTGNTLLTTTELVPYGTSEAAAKAKLTNVGYAKLSDGSYVAITINWNFDAIYNGNVSGTKAVKGYVTGTFPGGQIPTDITGTVSVIEQPVIEESVIVKEDTKPKVVENDKNISVSDKDGDTIVINLVKNDDGKVEKISLEMKSTVVSNNIVEEKANINVTVNAKLMEEALKLLVQKGITDNNIPISVFIPESVCLDELSNETVKSIEINLNIPEKVLQSTKIEVSNIVLKGELLKEIAYTNKTDLTIQVALGEEKPFVWSVDGDALKKTKKEIEDINLNLSTDRVAFSGELNCTMIDFSHSGELPTTATLWLPLTSDKLFDVKNGDSVYLYYVDTKLNKLLTLPKNEYKVDEHGYVELSISHCSIYVLLTKKASGKDVQELLEQVNFTKKKTTLYLDLEIRKSTRFGLNLPSTMESVIDFSKTNLDKMQDVKLEPVKIVYKSFNSKIVTISKTGKIIAKKEGKTKVQATLYLADGTSKNFVKEVTVKKSK